MGSCWDGFNGCETENCDKYTNKLRLRQVDDNDGDEEMAPSPPTVPVLFPGDTLLNKNKNKNNLPLATVLTILLYFRLKHNLWANKYERRGN